MLNEIGRIDRRCLGPAFRGYGAVTGVHANDQALTEEHNRVHQGGLIFYSCRAEDHSVGTCVHIALDGRNVPNAAAYLHRNRGSVKNRPNDIVVTGPAIARAVKIHHMQAPRARALPAKSDRYGIVREDCLACIVALFESYAAPIPNVDRRYDLQTSELGAVKPRPLSLLSSESWRTSAAPPPRSSRGGTAWRQCCRGLSPTRMSRRTRSLRSRRLDQRAGGSTNARSRSRSRRRHPQKSGAASRSAPGSTPCGGL